MFRVLTMLLCSAIANMVVANVVLAETIFSSIEMAKSRFSVFLERIPIFHISEKDNPLFVFQHGFDINVINVVFDTSELMPSGGDVHVSSKDNDGISCNIHSGQLLETQSFAATVIL